MCLIISLLPNTPHLDKEALLAAYELNNDGIGVAYSSSENNQLIVKRGFESFDDFYDYYLNISPLSSILIHFRKCSSGNVIPENLHPFIVNENLCFVFNGTIADLNWGEEKSDTFLLNELYIKKFAAFYKDLSFKNLIEKFIGFSKMVILDNEGKFIYFNESKGTWNSNKTIWYSNMLWEAKLKSKKKKAYVYTPSVTRHLHAGVNGYLPNLGNSDILKKKYCLIGDPYYKELSLDDLNNLHEKNHCGVKKLIRKRIIRPLDEISDTIKLEGQLKAMHDQKNNSDEIAQKIILNTSNRVPLQVSIGEILQLKDKK